MLRHLAAVFPDATLPAADLYESHVEFCAETFGSKAVVMPLDVDRFEFPESYDLIFCGSLITHLPRRSALAVLRLLARSLSINGVAVVSVHGRRSDELQGDAFDYFGSSSALSSATRYWRAKTAAQVSGFGFSNYDVGFRRRFFPDHALVAPGSSLDRGRRTRGVDSCGVGGRSSRVDGAV